MWCYSLLDFENYVE